jgi:hypothetical protein
VLAVSKKPLTPITVGIPNYDKIVSDQVSQFDKVFADPQVGNMLDHMFGPGMAAAVAKTHAKNTKGLRVKPPTKKGGL